MTDRVHPSTKPAAAPTAAPEAAPPPIPNPSAAKTQSLYNPARNPYRPAPAGRSRHKRRQFSCRRCTCLTCFWSILILIAVLLLAAIAGAAFYALYHPRRPVFSVTAVKIAAFSLATAAADDSTRLTAKINVTLAARNPNKKITFVYDPISVTVFSNSVNISSGGAGGFTNSPDGVAAVHAAVGVASQLLDADAVKSLKSGMNRPRKGLPIEIVADTTVGVKIDKVKMKKIGIRVRCDGIRGFVPKGKKVIPAAANTAGAKCTVDLRFKVFKWIF
ncbi:uncharacterized protein LOC127255472 [Andrographis paniculata]|uniref:uncharacterized protein LOC127255472 n=1 Tax=Andrographis paniculata TaxID=175694 RepID=UPI0021E8A196|nr:uncharacterized protein LOC127255472 [Andrographis paniculata]